MMTLYQYSSVNSNQCNAISLFVCSRRAAEQSENRVSKLKEELISTKELLGKTQLQQEVSEKDKEETGSFFVQ